MEHSQSVTDLGLWTWAWSGLGAHNVNSTLESFYVLALRLMFHQFNDFMLKPRDTVFGDRSSEYSFLVGDAEAHEHK
jgi:hypothetical protein